MAFPLHYFVFAPLVLLALLAFIVPGKSPFAVLKEAFIAIRDTRGGRLAAGAFVGVFVVSLIEGHFDDALTVALGYDLTAAVLAFEGDFVLNIQNAFLAMPGGDFVIAVLALTYTAGYIAWLVLPPFALLGLNRKHAAGTYACAFAVNYVLALPFYLFAPVQEVSWSGLTKTRPLLEEHWPGITEALRAESALDNCLPSLHVSIAVTALWFMVRYGNRRSAIVGWPLTIGVILSVLVLAIHWGVDTAAGIPFGVLCAWIAERLFPIPSCEKPGQTEAG
ncbi:MAG: membrane-associated phospholipid phosphatase [Planctomycetota bacterium]|jgi:membrane-associated phospholipid phosphatase